MRRPIAAIAATLLTAGPAGAAVKIGAPAPALIGKAFDGAPLDLAALRGQVALVHVWASWCPPCRAEMPALDAFARAHPGTVSVIALDTDARRDQAKARRIMSAFSYPAMASEDARADGFGTPASLPITYLIDRQGIVRQAFTPRQGLLGRARLEAALAALDRPGAAEDAQR